MIRLIGFSLMLICSPAVLSQNPADSNQVIDKSLAYLNELRSQAGLIELKPNAQLQLAAQGHAEYLFQHRQWGHQQQAGRQGYTGQTPLKRMLAAGYPSRHNSENVSSHSGNAGPAKSVNGLMSAIYHRFGFLSFDYDEVGIGYASDNRFHSYVYNMGNSNKAGLCRAPEQDNINGQYFFKVCADESKKIQAGVFEKASKDNQLKNTDIVVWPPDGGKHIPPAFYEEAPDPLPHHDVSGYPVSLQFNPGFFKDAPPLVKRFELFRLPDNQPVKILVRFNQQKDINRKFTEFEHAIFPQYRLDWDTRYRVEVDYLTTDNREQQLSWTFRTANIDMPFYKVFGGEVIQETESSFAVYSPPVSKNDGRSEYQVSFVGFQDIDVSIVDAHTLIISPRGARGQATFDFHGKRFKVVR